MLRPILDSWIRNIHGDFALHEDVELVSLLAVCYNIFTCIIDLVFKHLGNFFDYLWIVLEKLDLSNDFD